MKKIHVLLFILFLTLPTFAQKSILSLLQNVAQISEIKPLHIEGFKEYYLFRFEQPVDHNDPSKGTFKQLVSLGHNDFNAPMVVNLAGYQMESHTPLELTKILGSNQLMIEHRFFDTSVPSDGPIPWDYLTIYQAATDQHVIIQTLRKIYEGCKWVSTGISKGGQTTVYHRYFYPQDVEVSVPYVAPINLDYVDPRIEHFLERLGDNRTKGFKIFDENRDSRIKYQIFDFQKYCFEHLDSLMMYATAFSKSRHYNFELVGGLHRAMQLSILEFPFAFWQWGSKISEMPIISGTDVISYDEIFHYLVRISDLSFFEDASIRKLYPFYYAALTETGMYDYKIKPFKHYLNEDKKDITFRFAFPKDATPKPFNTNQMLKINKWLQTDAEHILFIYGAIDPWSATAVDLKKNDKCEKYVMQDKCHSCRINSFDMVTRINIIETIKDWLK